MKLSKELIKVLAILDCDEKELNKLYNELGEYLGKNNSKGPNLNDYFGTKDDSLFRFMDKLNELGFSRNGIKYVYDNYGNFGFIDDCFEGDFNYVLVDAKK